MTPLTTPPLYHDDPRKFRGPHSSILTMVMALLPTAMSSPPAMPEIGPLSDNTHISLHSSSDIPLCPSMPIEQMSPLLAGPSDLPHLPSSPTMLRPDPPYFGRRQPTGASSDCPCVPWGPKSNLDLNHTLSSQKPDMTHP